jgi:RNA polymerase sigma-70 factor (ECF subfamily)
MAMQRPPGVVDLDEERWIRSALGGDVSAFNQLVERYQTLAYNVAYRTLGHPEDAADATQEAFFSAFRALAEFRGGSFKSWLLRIVVNACYDTRRRAQRRPSTSMDALVEEYDEAPWPDTHAEDPEGTMLSHEALETIASALHQLPDEQRMAIVLVDVQGLSYEEAADVLSCAIGTIRSRLARGRARVRDLLVATGNFP